MIRKNIKHFIRDEIHKTYYCFIINFIVFPIHFEQYVGLLLAYIWFLYIYYTFPLKNINNKVFQLITKPKILVT